MSYFCHCRYAITKAFCVAFVMTFFSMFDVPVFWPILLCYWLVLFVLTMKRQITHMIKYKYLPFNIGKQVSCKNNIYSLPLLYYYSNTYYHILLEFLVLILIMRSLFNNRSTKEKDLLLVPAAIQMTEILLVRDLTLY